MKNTKNLKNYLFAFIIPFLICLTILYFKNVLLNIENIYVSDLRLQHLVFINYFKNILLNKSSIFYSFSAGMGSPMLSTIIFYCISPINLITLIISDIKYAVLFIYIIKISLSGLTMFILLKSKTEKTNFITILFSTCYALSAFAINYFFCIFWFDSLYLAPLVIIGIDKIFKHEKINLLYIFSLALAIICNIQMGFGLCLFALIYYIYSYNINYSIKENFNKFKKLGLVFIISSLSAGAISIGALLGFGLDYANISIARDIQVTTHAEVSNLGYILKNFFTVGNLKTDYYNNYEPFIYCGLIVSFFSILYLFDRDIDEKKRKNAFGVILIFIISFCINFINLFWHLSTPVLLNYRYSAYLGLFLTILAYECYISKNKLITKDIIILVISLLLSFFIIIAYSQEIYIIWTFIFLILIFTLILLTKNKSKKFEVLLSIAVIAEIFTNGYLSIYTSSDLPMGKYSSYDSLKKLASLNNFDDNYRIIYNYSYTDFTNDTLLLNKNSSVRYFSSVINGNVLKFFERNMSGVGNNNYMLSAYDSPMLISLLGNKYLYLTDELNNSIYKKIESYEIESYNYTIKDNEIKTVYLYENPYALSLGYIIENDCTYEKEMDLIDYQNNIIKAFTGSNKDVLIRLNYTLNTNSEICANSNLYSCKTYNIVNNTNNVLIYVHSLFDRYSLDSNIKRYIDVNKPLLLSTINNNIDLTLEYSNYVDDSFFSVSTYNESNLIENLSILQENMLENIKINGNILTGEINSSKKGILFLSIPYNEKFKIYVDGKKVNYYPLLDKSFIGLDIEKGMHNIEIRYIDENFKWYIIATIFSLIITIVLYYFINKSISKRLAKEQQDKQEKLNNQKIKREKKKNKNKK